MVFDPKKVLISGSTVVANIKNKPYAGVITAEDKEGGFIVRLTRPDQTILSLMLDSACIVQCISDEGLAYRFECRLLTKKVPHIGLSYPSGNFEGINVRKNPRISVSYWTALLGVVNEGGKATLKPVGEGSIVDLSLGGCRFMTSNKYKVNDPAYLSFEYLEGKESLRFKVIIKLIRTAPYGLTYYSSQFDNPTPEFLKIIQTILDNPSL